MGTALDGEHAGLGGREIQIRKGEGCYSGDAAHLNSNGGELKVER